MSEARAWMLQHFLETLRAPVGQELGVGLVDSWAGAQRFSEALTEKTLVCICCWAPEGRAKAAAAVLSGKGEFGSPRLLGRKPRRPMLPSRSSLGLLCVSGCDPGPRPLPQSRMRPSGKETVCQPGFGLGTAPSPLPHSSARGHRLSPESSHRWAFLWFPVWGCHR